MRFLTPPQTLSEYRHQKMPVYETLATIGTTVAVGALAGGASYGLSQLNKPPGAGAYTGAQYLPNAQQFANTQQEQQQNMLDFSKLFAQQGTAQNIALQNKVTPGSQAQRGLAQNQLNSYIQGQVPMDVQQNTQRAIAQSLGGGYNPFTGGGQAPSAFARNIGQTSLGLSQYGLSAAPTWQQLANSMVVSPTAGAQLALSAGQLGNQQVMGTAQLGMGVAENQYQAQMNQYQAQQMQNQQAINAGLGGASMGLGVMNSMNQASYLNNLGNLSGSPTMGTGYSTPLASTGFGAQQSSLPAIYGTPSFSSVANVGTGLNYSGNPFAGM